MAVSGAHSFTAEPCRCNADPSKGMGMGEGATMELSSPKKFAYIHKDLHLHGLTLNSG